ncbi:MULTISPECIES: hypothetical protein [Mycobacteriaceae]|uniref:Uncharacterized protein n=1 Tax=Mycolicibacterium parafortuitum TaxID=39692 RepID=A0ACC6MAY1_MYCPF|nr:MULTISPECIES: hypothetical protein [Mycobacteriaceae]MDZ5084091.1 hypothetical protein [Mycolicibacterium parafortuitum]GFM16781.1 putative secreted protein [Mycobacterium sp. PO1]GFM24448.1 putative secreted protein [Mycobacterium sp. PO2]
MKLTVAMALAAPLVGLAFAAGNASAQPNTVCDGDGCVPYVDRTAHLGGSCDQSTRYNFGIDASGNTLACNFDGQWVSETPLVGVRLLRSPCTSAGATAQSPDGVPLTCDGVAWSADYSVIFYG